MQILDHIPFHPTPDEVMRHLRVNPDSEDAQRLARLLDQVTAIARPKAVYNICYVRGRTSNTVDIEGILFTSRVLRVNLDQVHRVFPYLATCGRELDDLPGTESDPLSAYWLEEIKVMALGRAMACVREHVAATHAPGKLSAMAPGSLEDWPITQQRPLFSLLGDVESAIGVALTDSFLMLPLKSISGLLFPTETTFESCRLCPRERCEGRRAPYDEHLWQQRYAETPPHNHSRPG